MKKLVAAVMLWGLIAMSSADAQNLVDTLNIIEENQVVAQVIANNIYTQKESGQWKELIAEFKDRISSVDDKIPEYQAYNIEFLRGFNLTIEERDSEKSVKKYKIEKGEFWSESYKSSAELSDSGLKVVLNFDELNHLSTRDYVAMISQGFEKLAKRRRLMGLIKDSYETPDRYDFNSLKGQIERRNKQKAKIVGYFDGGVGFLKSKPIFAMNYGAGVAFGDQRKNAIYLSMSHIYMYSTEEQQGLSGSMIGVLYRPLPTASIGFAFSTSSSNPVLESDSRMSISVYFPRGGKFTINAMNYGRDNTHVGFEYGIPIDLLFDVGQIMNSNSGVKKRKKRKL